MPTRLKDQVGRLHLLLSPEQRAVDDCLAVLRMEDTVLLLDRGVRLVMDPGALERLCAAAGTVTVAAADLEARGLPVPDGIAALGDEDWARRVRELGATLSWT